MAEVESTAAADAAASEVHMAMVPPCRLCVRATAGARVVGKGGESIRNIRSSSGATVKVFQDELPEPLRRRDENIVMASCGETSSLRAAISAILQRIFDRSGLPAHAERERERPYVVDVVVPERAAGPLVGPGGERIKALIDELGCSIDVVREPLSGIHAQRRVRVLSREQERVEVAVWRIQSILSELITAGTLTAEHFELREALPTEHEKERMKNADEEVPFRLLLSPNEAAVVVGKMGFNVRRLRDIASVSVDDAATPSGHREAICTVSRAPLEDRLRVVRLISADVSASAIVRRGDSLQGEGAAPEGCRPVTITVLLPVNRWLDVVGMLQSSDGPCPSSCSLCSSSGVDASVKDWGPLGSTVLRAVEMCGTEDQVAAATWRLHQALEPWEPEEVPARPEKFQRSQEDDTEDGAPKGGGKGKTTYANRSQAGEQIVPVRRLPPPDAVDNDRVMRFSPSSATQEPSRAAAFSNPAPGLEPVRAVSGTDRISKEPAPSVPVAAEVYRPAAVFTPVPAREPVKPVAFTPSPQQVPDAPLQNGHAYGHGDIDSCPIAALKVVVPNTKMAAFLMSDASGVAQRANVKLQLWPGSGAQPVLEVTGTAAANAAACYIIQEQMWLAASF